MNFPHAKNNMTISFFAQGIPKGQPRPRAFARKFGDKFSARMYDPGTAEGWKQCVAVAAKSNPPMEPFSGPVILSLRFWMPRPKNHFRSNGNLKEGAPQWHTGKPDADNFAKAVMDALTVLGTWRDDSQVCDLRVTKNYAVTETGCGIQITPL